MTGASMTDLELSDDQELTDDAVPRWVYPTIWALPAMLGLFAATGLVSTDLMGPLTLMLLGVLGFWMCSLMLHEEH